ncbi:ATP-grasp domain-containing protein [Agromyces allii]|uniref:ATP-grasp domain-containing protein n=1 Tax=Agromyces allii TaxID=393607 RepID=A0ABP5CL67_9MICO|nr:hypothetical protein [Agromyces allii]
MLDLDLIIDNGGASGLSIDDSGCSVKLDGEWIDLGRRRQGWLRRFHRAEWGLGVETGSVKALELGTWYSAYSSLIDAANAGWVTKPQALRRAESKVSQWQSARSLGVPYPRTVVTTSRDAVTATFTDEIVVKPLGTGQFISEGEVRTVFVEPMMPDDARLQALSSAPFMIQERLHASQHLRVVTVGNRLWAAALDVQVGAPADWRQCSANHSGFQELEEVPQLVRDRALLVAQDLELGYSSQDWIRTEAGESILVDVNPGGQWLFLPRKIGIAVADAIADLLLERP